MQQLPGRACDEFIAAVNQLGEPEHIPHFDAISERLIKATGWLRKPKESDYIVEPDVFHDLFGHVPLLFNPTFADGDAQVRAQPIVEAGVVLQGERTCTPN